MDVSYSESPSGLTAYRKEKAAACGIGARGIRKEQITFVTLLGYCRGPLARCAKRRPPLERGLRIAQANAGI